MAKRISSYERRNKRERKARFVEGLKIAGIVVCSIPAFAAVILLAGMYGHYLANFN